jgi:RHS repeat-associated protein
MMYPDNKKHSRCAGLPEVQTCSPMNDRCCHRRNRLNGQTGSALKGAGGIGGLLARSDNTQMIIGSSSEHDYYHADGNGNVTMLINSSQAVVAKYLYDPFGNTLSLSGSLAAANVYRFSSKAWNDNAGLYYYGRRFYDPNLQRFVNRDPIGELGGLNLYAYVANNPINRMDPLGLAPGDKWFGYNDPAFQDWYHRKYKQPGDPDADQDTMDDAYNQWLDEGSPDLRKGHRDDCHEDDENPEADGLPENENQMNAPQFSFPGCSTCGVNGVQPPYNPVPTSPIPTPPSAPFVFPNIPPPTPGQIGVGVGAAAAAGTAWYMYVAYGAGALVF